MRLFTLVLLLCTTVPTKAQTFSERLVQAALERTRVPVSYDGRYQRIPYPGGDVDADKGVCTDVIIRSYRALGVDLQQLVHEDMRKNFSRYPSQRIWGLKHPDTNIDHRRVPNLQTFFTRHGETLSTSTTPQDYRPGDLVTWVVAGNLPHIGIVSDKRNPGSQHLMVVHNIGQGPQLEDRLFINLAMKIAKLISGAGKHRHGPQGNVSP